MKGVYFDYNRNNLGHDYDVSADRCWTPFRISLSWASARRFKASSFKCETGREVLEGTALMDGCEYERLLPQSVNGSFGSRVLRYFMKVSPCRIGPSPTSPSSPLPRCMSPRATSLSKILRQLHPIAG